jgi:hypothetical protein
MSMQTIAGQVGLRRRARRVRPGLAIPISTQYTMTERFIGPQGQLEDSTEYTVTDVRPNHLASVPCSWLRDVEMQLDLIEFLPEGWDSHGAPSPTSDYVDAGRGLIECLAQAEGLPRPCVNPTRNGGVQFEWEIGERYFELEIVREGEATYLYCDDADNIEETGVVSEGQSLEPVLAYIRKVACPQ